MEKLFTILAFISYTFSVIGQKDPTVNPYWLISDLNSKGISYKSSGQVSIGKVNNETMFPGPKPVNHQKKVLSVTIPSGATILGIHPFIVNIDGLKDPGGDPNNIPWGTTPDIDYRWGTFHSPQKTALASGETLVTVEYDNWSDVETRAGFLIVEYSGGIVSKTQPAKITVDNTNSKVSVKFYNPTGLSRSVYLYVTEVENNSTVNFCDVATYVGNLQPGDEVFQTLTKGKMLMWGAYTIEDCTYGNSCAATGSTLGMCPTSCEISINAQ